MKLKVPIIKKIIKESSAVYMPFEDIGFNKAIEEIGQLEVCFDEEKLAAIAYEQHMRNANITGTFEINLTEIGKEHWLRVAKSIIAQMENIMSVKKVK